MKQLIFETGGRPLANDDLETLQQETFAALTAHLQDAPPLVLSGCKVQNGVIGPGLLWLGGEIHRYAGASGVALPVEVILGDVEVLDERAYQTGGTKACITERQLVTQVHSVFNLVAKVVINAGGAELTYTKWLESRSRHFGEIQWLANLRPEDYDTTGKGWPDLTSRGWAICNGQNGTADLRGRFVVGQDRGRADYDSISKTGGAETVTLDLTQIPPHSHTVNASNPGSAAVGNTLGKSSNTQGGTLDFKSKDAGGGQPHENRPPFYVLAARQWIGL